MEEKTVENLVSPKLGELKNALINFIVPLICLVSSVLLGIFIIYPYYKTKPQIQTDIKTKTEKKQVLQQKVLALKKLEDFGAMLEENSKIVDKVLYSEANVPQFLDEVFQISTNAGLKVSRLSYSYGEASSQTSGSGAGVATYQEVVAGLGTEGGYDQITSALEAVENAARVVSVTNFRFGVSDEQVTSATFSVISPFLFVQSNAVTDDPIVLDVTTQTFIDFMNRIKGMKYYEFLNSSIPLVEEEAEAAAPTTP